MGKRRRRRIRRKRRNLRYTPYILILAGASTALLLRFGGGIVEDLKYQHLQKSLVNNEEETEEVIDVNETMEETIENALSEINIDAFKEVVTETNQEEPEEEVIEEEVIEEEIVEEIVPNISDELLASGYDFQNINFDELLELNDEADAWITIDGTNINYPVMYAPDREDKDFYLHHDINGNDSTSGTLYIYHENNSLNNNQEDISDVTMIFGHCMRGAKMFSELRNYGSQSYYENHPFGVIYTPDGYAYKVTFFAGMVTPGQENDGIYWDQFYSEEHFDWFINTLKERSTFTSDVELNYGDKIIALATCEYTGGKNSRYFLYGVMQKQYTNENQIDNNVGYQRVHKQK